MPERLKVPPIPHAFGRAMRIWRDLHHHRETGMGLGTITWPDMHAYSALTGDTLSRGDIEAIAIIDGEFHAARAAAEERRSKLAERRKPKGKAR